MACLIYNVIHLSVDYGQRRSQLDPLAVDVIRLVCRAGKGENFFKKKDCWSGRVGKKNRKWSSWHVSPSRSVTNVPYSSARLKPSGNGAKHRGHGRNKMADRPDGATVSGSHETNAKYFITTLSKHVVSTFYFVNRKKKKTGRRLLPGSSPSHSKPDVTDWLSIST